MDEVPHLQPLPKGFGGGIGTPKDIITRPFNYAERNSSFKIGLVVFWEMMGVGNWLPFNYFGLLKRALELSISISALYILGA